MNFDPRAPRTDNSDGNLSYFAELNRLCVETQVSDLAGRTLELDAGFAWIARRTRATADSGNSMYFIGNGGSAGIASHQAIDYANNGRVRALALNDSAALTCIGNDHGYAHVFSRQLEIHGRDGDLLVAVSSSGQSPSILNAVETARERGMAVATFSGFRADNPLRALGDVNLYVDSDRYGFVELAHGTLIHAILDLHVAPARPE